MAEMIKCTIARDFWDADGNRHRAGEKEIEVPLEAALDGIESGALKRVKAKKAAKKAEPKEEAAE